MVPNWCSSNMANTVYQWLEYINQSCCKWIQVFIIVIIIIFSTEWIRGFLISKWIFAFIIIIFSKWIFWSFISWFWWWSGPGWWWMTRGQNFVDVRLHITNRDRWTSGRRTLKGGISCWWWWYSSRRLSQIPGHVCFKRRTVLVWKATLF